MKKLILKVIEKAILRQFIYDGINTLFDFKTQGLFKHNGIH